MPIKKNKKGQNRHSEIRLSGKKKGKNRPSEIRLSGVPPIMPIKTTKKKGKIDTQNVPSFHSNTKNYVGKICKNSEVLIGKKMCKNSVGEICKNSEGLICKNSEPEKKLCTQSVGKFC